MKKIISLVIACCAFISVSFAQSASFEETYSKLIDSNTITIPTFTASGAMQQSSSQIITIEGKKDADNQGSMIINLTANTITASGKKGPTYDSTITIDGIINATIEGQKIENMKASIAGQVILTTDKAYFKLNSIAIDTSKLPSESQGDIEIGIGYLKKNFIGKWIKVQLDNEISKILQAQSAIDPETILVILKQYPILKTTGHSNGTYSVKLDSKNTIKLIEQIKKKLTQGTSLTTQEKKAIKAAVEQSTIQGTLTDGVNPMLNLSREDSEIITNSYGAMTISTGGTKVNGKVNISDENEKASLSFNFDFKKISNNSTKTIANVNIDFVSQMIDAYDKTYYETGSIGIGLESIQTYGIIENYKFTLPKKAKTIQQTKETVYNNSPEKYLGLGKKYINQGNYKKAEEMTKKGILIYEQGNTFTSQENHAIAYNNLCRAQAKQGKYIEALENCNKSLEIRPNNEATLDSRAFTKLGLNDLTGALDDSNQGIKLSPDDHLLYETRVKIYEKLGMKKEAQQDKDTIQSLTNKKVINIYDIENDNSLTINQGGEKMSAIPECKKYIATMTCIIEQSSEEAKKPIQESFNQAISTLETLNTKQLTKVCTENIDAINQQKDMIENIGCTL